MTIDARMLMVSTDLSDIAFPYLTGARGADNEDSAKMPVMQRTHFLDSARHNYDTERITATTACPYSR